ncbi:MAG: radical SAM protein [Pseudonocardiaceae bacterium]
MTTSGQCSVCANGWQLEDCSASLRRIGVLRANWDCWEDCNLSCQFCFRSRGSTLDIGAAKTLLSAVAFGGVEHFTFTGGDPSLRPDLLKLVNFARSVGMRTEILTNAQYQPQRVRDALLASDLVGLSLDGSCPDVHDRFRSKPGNYARVIKLMNFLEDEGHLYVVRTVVARPNHGDIPRLTEVLAERPGLLRWSLQQFSAVEDGYRNRARYEISSTIFDSVCDVVKSKANNKGIQISCLSDETKIGLYFLIDPHGQVINRVGDPNNGVLPGVGSLLSSHLADLAERVKLDPRRHNERYGSWFGGPHDSHRP